MGSQESLPSATKDLITLALSSSERLAKRQVEVDNLIARQQDEIEHLRGLVIELAHAQAHAALPDPSIIIMRQPAIDIKTSGTNHETKTGATKRGSLPPRPRPFAPHKNRAITAIRSSAAFMGVGRGQPVANRFPFKAPLRIPVRTAILNGTNLTETGAGLRKRIVPPIAPSGDSDTWRPPESAKEDVQKSGESGYEKKEHVHDEWCERTESGSDTEEDRSAPSNR